MSFSGATLSETSLMKSFSAASYASADVDAVPELRLTTCFNDVESS